MRQGQLTTKTMSKCTPPRDAAFLFLIAVLSSACAITSSDTLPTAGAAAVPSTPMLAAQPTTHTASATTAPTAAPAAPSVGLVGRFANSPKGSVAALAFEGMRAAASSNSARYTLNAIDLDALDSADPHAAIEMSVGQGDKIVIVVGADLVEATAGAAAKHAEVQFISVDQSHDNPPPNLFALGGSGSRLDEEGFLAGALAGFVTKARIVGVVVGGGTTQGKVYQNGFAHGLRYSCGDCQLWSIELDDDADRDAGAETAARLKSVNADVIFAAAGEAGEAGLEAAAAQGMWVIGAGRDYSQTLSAGKDRVLGSVLRRPELSLPMLLNALLGGNTTDRALPFSLANGNITMASQYGPDVSPAVINLMNDLISKLSAGELDTGIDPTTGEEK